MQARKLEVSDLGRLEEIHQASGFKYEFPYRQNGALLIPPLFVVNQTVIDDSGQLVNAAGARLTAEIFGFMDPNWKTPGLRLDALTLLHEVMRAELRVSGLEDVHAWLPPQMRRFGGRLMRQFNWNRQTWDSYSRSTEKHG